MRVDTSRSLRIALLGLVALGLLALWRPLTMAAPACLTGQWWHGCLDTVNGVAFVTLAAVPLSVALAWALSRRRSSTWRLSLAEVGLVHGTVPFAWLVLMPGSGAGVVPGRVSAVPLQDLVTMGWPGIVANLLVLAALGFFAPVRFAAPASLPRIAALAAGCSVLVETAQFAFRLDRVSSVDDVLLNAAGAVLAALVSRPWWRR